MRFQEQKGTCGAAAVVNACRAFGVKISEKKAIKLANTDNEGTDEHGIISALRTIGLTAEEFKGNKRNLSWQWLHGALLQGRVIILCVDEWSHWVTLAGSLLDRVVLIDSTATDANRQENGVHVLSSERLMRRWAKKNEEHRYYGIAARKG